MLTYLVTQSISSLLGEKGIRGKCAFKLHVSGGSGIRGKWSSGEMTPNLTVEAGLSFGTSILSTSSSISVSAVSTVTDSQDGDGVSEVILLNREVGVGPNMISSQIGAIGNGHR